MLSAGDCCATSGRVSATLTQETAMTRRMSSGVRVRLLPNGVCYEACA
jgi:hypothetical protein